MEREIDRRIGAAATVMLSTVEKELIMLKEWFDINKLSLNENKTKCMVFGGVRALKQKTERVYETKFLGVILDHQLEATCRIYLKESI